MYFISLLVIILLLINLSVSFLRINNVCREFEDYITILQNPNCWYNPDIGATPEQLAQRYGYSLERHRVITDDGFILTAFRLPSRGRKKRSPILIQHGINFDGRQYLINGKNSLAFLLSDRGFDVWIGNVRGTPFSSRHLKFSPHQTEYWDFSFHEMGIYDIPANIEYIKTHTNYTGKITLLGYSMGSTASLIYTSERSKHARNNISSMTLLAPVAFMTNVKSILKILAYYTDLIKKVLAPLSSYGFGANFQLLNGLSGLTCSTFPGLFICGLLAIILTGHNPKEILPENLPVGLSHVALGISFKTLIHYGQLMNNTGEFAKFDYGEIENLRRYNSPMPPSYSIQKIRMPVHMFYGTSDLLADPDDVLKLYGSLNSKKTITKSLPDGSSNFAHLDFGGGRNSEIVYKLIIQNLE